MDNLNLNDIEVLEIDDFESNNKLNEVPKPPKMNDFNNKSNSKKENGKIYLKIILILILIFFIGIGLYLFLSFAKKNTSLELKIEEKTIELGQELDNTSIEYENCKVDLSKVDIKKVGKYEYIIKCDRKKYTSFINVKDTTAPAISLKVLNIEKNQSFEAKDFILGSYDLSEINYKFTNNDDISNYNQKNGIYIVPISAVDKYENMTNDYGILIVTNVVADKYLSAFKITSTTYDATLKVTDKIGFNSVNYYINALRIYEYTFNSKDEYKKIKKESLETNTLDNIAGKIIFDDEKLIIKLVKELSREELNVLNGAFPATYNDISELYYKSGYTNKIEKN